MKKFASIAALAVAGLVSNAFGVAVTVSTVSAYAPNPNGLSITDATATGVTNTSQQITLANFKTAVSTAFGNNTGGVVNFETAQGFGTSVNDVPKYGNSSADPISATYGTAQTSTLQFYRNDGATNTPSLTSAADNGLNVISGTQYLGTSNQGSPVNIVFNKALSALGLTLVPRNADRNVTMTVTLSDASTVVLTGATVTTATTTAGAAVFFGFQPTGGNTITALNISNTQVGFARYDDLGFIVAVPEPASLSLLGLGGLGLLRRRRA